MSNKIKIAPSMLSSDFSRLREELIEMESAGADYIHLDVMDGHFVPNLTFGAPVIKTMRPHTTLPFDVHLMISEPLRYVDDFAKAGADIITFHVEADSPIMETISKIKAHGIMAGLVIKPKTPASAIFPYLEFIDMVLVMSVEPGFGGQSFMPDSLLKVAQIKSEAERLKKDILLEIDGGISCENIKSAADAGVDIAVAGTSVFGAPDRKKAIDEMKKM